MRKNIHFIDVLDAAQVIAPGPGHVAIQTVTLGRDARTALFQHPCSSIRFPAVTLGRNPTLSFGYAVKETAWERIASPVVFSIYIRADGRRRRRIFTTMLDTRRQPQDRHWHNGTLDLSRYQGMSVELTLETRSTRRRRTAYGWSVWSDPVVQMDVPDQAPLKAPSLPRPHILLVTADALRYDMLGCTGNRNIQTPHIDALAAEGLLFTHARAQSPSTLGSYASLLTGNYQLHHGVASEWDCLPPSMKTLPDILGTAGYRTVFVPSEQELYDDCLGIGHRFNTVIPCLGAPAQRGEVTSRRVEQALDALQHSQAPLFFWVQYFDTHPPAIAPAPFDRMYYDGDPTDPANRFQEDKIAYIRGIETAAEIQHAMEFYKQGGISTHLVERLRATAAMLRGDRKHGPDMAVHLLALGPDSCLGKPPAAFARWLDTQADVMEQGKMTTEFLEWLHEFYLRLEQIEAEIIGGFKGIVDYRYPVSQYRAGISSFDAQVGHLSALLRQRGLYDNTMIIVISPHGEMLGEHDIHFHHHSLNEEVLRIPLLIKPALTQNASPARIEGVMDAVDLMPTLLAAIGETGPATGGRNRWDAVRTGRPIPEHDSFAEGWLGRNTAILSGDVVYHHSACDMYFSSAWQWRSGEERLYRLDGMHMTSLPPDQGQLTLFRDSLAAFRKG